MSIGDFAGGFTNAISQYLTGERDRVRKQEDDEIDYQRQMINALISRPDFNPAHLGRALHDLIDLGQGKTGKRKMQKGAAGFTGHTELPLSQFFSGVMNGSTPIYGAPITQAPQQQRAPVPSVGVQTGVQGFPEFGDPFNDAPKQPLTNGVPGYDTPEEQGFTGETALQAQVPIPPKGAYVPREAKGLASAAQQYQEGLLYRPEELAQQKAQAEGVVSRSRQYGQRQGDVDTFRELGASDEDIRDSMMQKGRGAADNFQEYVYMMPDGSQFSARVNLRTNETFDLQNNPMILPQGARRIGLGAPNQINMFQDDAGRVSGVATNRYEPNLGAAQIPVAPGVRGRTSPDGPVAYIQGPNGTPVPARLPRQGSRLNPSLDPFAVPQPPQGGSRSTPMQPNTGNAPASTTGRSAAPAPGRGRGAGPAAQTQTAAQSQQPPQYATQYRPPDGATLAAINNAETGLSIVQQLKSSYDPRFTGTVQGPRNQIMRHIPGAPADPQFVDFQANWATMRNELNRLNAGLTQTPLEMKNVKEALANLNDKDANFLAALAVVEQHFQRKHDIAKKNAGIAVPFRRPSGQTVTLQAPDGTTKVYPVEDERVLGLMGMGAKVVK